MSEVNLKDFQGALSTTFRRYLFTLNFLPDSESELRDAFWRALGEQDVISREPLLSVIPAYPEALSAASLLGRESVPGLDKRLAKFPIEAFDAGRPLYEHQIRSLEQAQNRRNLVVATGTGSGKTECFLLPVLDDALRHPGPGVRAIVIYPLNALANDQLSRLRKLLPALPEITFGRYTGDTPYDRTDLTQAEKDEICDPNERFSRHEIRSAPPHILLTNFAMLEYLLLRPQDNDIFLQQRLQYVILDEAHSYNGAQGIEVSLLMRRLQQAFPHCNLQFILTSATLGNDRAAIARFGTQLTGGAFEADDVIVGAVVNPFKGVDPPTSLDTYVHAVPNDEAMERWFRAVDSCTELRKLILSSGIGRVTDLPKEANPGLLIAHWLARNSELANLHDVASRQSLTLTQAAESIWGTASEDAIRITQWLVVLGARAVPHSNSAPLLPARYHLFFRGLRGGSLCLSPKCPERRSHRHTMWSNLAIEDRLVCEACSAHVLPLLTCVHCGSPVLRVYEDGNGNWQSIAPKVGQRAHLLTWLTPTSEGEDEDDDSVEGREAHLCLNCRGLALGSNLSAQCCQSPDHIRLYLLRSDGDGLLKKCPTCGGEKRPFPSVLREFFTGEEAATAVLAEALVRALPEEDAAKPAHGRRLLAFSDSRQRAAHFAPYLARTTAETQYMRPLLEALQEAANASDGAASFDDVAERFLKSVRKQPYVIVRKTNDEDGEFTSSIKRPGQLYKEDNEILKRECLITLLQQFTAPLRARNTLPGMALASVAVDWNDDQREELPKRVPEFFRLGTEQGWRVLQNLLCVFLRRKALIFPEGILLGHLMSSGPKVVTFHHNLGDSMDGRQRVRWNPYEAKQKKRVVTASPQAEIVARLLGCDKFQDEPVISRILDNVWAAFRDLEVLQQDYPNEFQLNYSHLFIRTCGPWFSCERCGALTLHPIHDRCVVPACGGTLKLLSAADIERRWQNHHWYQRNTKVGALPLEVREHTAQLTNDAGREYQRKFTAGDINVLSSSTTFEMGVDVGQLKSVLLRNVPPTPANYIQRAGRAGRRREGAAYAVTYARSFPHDQVHFHDPRSIVSGSVPIPRINIANPRLTQRHINSFLLEKYLRNAKVPAAGEQISVAEFFLSPSTDDSAALRYTTWLRDCKMQLAGPVSQVIGEGCPLTAEDSLCESGSLLASVRGELIEQLAAYESQRKELATAIQTTQGKERSGVVRGLESVERLAEQLRAERLIDHLSAAHWLPSYAFPQDVVKLLVMQPNLTGRMRLERDAEYGIAEYAPGSEVVADGLLLTSRALNLQNRELKIEAYRVCVRCNRVEFAAQRKDLLGPCTSCGNRPTGPRANPRDYVIPRGFTTLIDEPAREVRLHRLKPPPNSEVYLIKGAIDFQEHQMMAGISLGYSQQGELFRANCGHKFQQFRICPYCGRAVEGRNGRHTKPWGLKCAGQRIITVDLAHRFETDTLQIRFDGVQPPPPPVDRTDFWISLQTAVTMAAADVLVIPPRDIDGTFRSQSEQGSKGELVIYDRVPGGAGYVERIQEELPRILEDTLCRTRDCKNPQCDPLGSCYACLRSYGNQFQWESLHRNLVSDWLFQILSGT
jgi:ATP-dependent helicase YprA (DUF1998 family)